MRLPPKMSFILCIWTDITGGINLEQSKIRPVKCSTVGWLLEIKKDYILIASSIYEGDDEEKVIDGTAIPLGCINQIKRLKRP